MGPFGPGQLVDPAVPLTRARVTRDSWLTLQAIGHSHELHGTAG